MTSIGSAAMNAEDLVLGIDGGGTKTVAWLAERNEPGANVGDKHSAATDGDNSVTCVGRGESSASNPGVVGSVQAIATLESVISDAFSDAGVEHGTVAAACLAISGTERSVHRSTIVDWAAARSLAKNIRLINDAEAVLAGGSRDGWGVALIAGTGSFAFGRNPQGVTARVGGWGYLFGDEGSGHALGVAGLRAAAHDADGRGPSTSLLSSVMGRFGVDDPRELVSMFYGSANDARHRPAELAPLVTAAAEGGDDVALRIVRGAAGDLAQLVMATCRQLDFSPHAFPLAVAGGVLNRSPLMFDAFQTALSERDHLTPSIRLVADPVRGAVILARHAARDR